VSVSETCPDDAQGVPKAADGKCPQFMLPVSNCPHCICEKFYELSPDGRCFLTPPSCSEGMSFNLEQGDCIKPSIVPGAAAEGRSGCGGCSLCAN
jgi:hypothetical protein